METRCHPKILKQRFGHVLRRKLKEKKMRVKLFTVFMTIIGLATAGFAENVFSGVGNAAKDTGRVTEKAATRTAHGTAKATKLTARGGKKAATETGRGTEKAAKGTTKAAKVTAEGTGKAVEKTGHGVKDVVTKI
jgi:hypothetical protein